MLVPIGTLVSQIVGHQPIVHPHGSKNGMRHRAPTMTKAMLRISHSKVSRSMKLRAATGQCVMEKRDRCNLTIDYYTMLKLVMKVPFMSELPC